MKITINKYITVKKLVAELENGYDLTVEDLQHAINKVISLINRNAAGVEACHKKAMREVCMDEVPDKLFNFSSRVNQDLVYKDCLKILNAYMAKLTTPSVQPVGV